MVVCARPLDVVRPALLPLQGPTQEDLPQLQELFVVPSREQLDVFRFQSVVDEREKGGNVFLVGLWDIWDL